MTDINIATKVLSYLRKNGGEHSDVELRPLFLKSFSNPTRKKIKSVLNSLTQEKMIVVSHRDNLMVSSTGGVEIPMEFITVQAKITLLGMQYLRTYNQSVWQHRLNIASFISIFLLICQFVYSVYIDNKVNSVEQRIEALEFGHDSNFHQSYPASKH